MRGTAQGLGRRPVFPPRSPSDPSVSIRRHSPKEWHPMDFYRGGVAEAVRRGRAQAHSACVLHTCPLHSSYCWPCPPTPAPASYAALPEDAVQDEGTGLGDARRPCTAVHPHPRSQTTVPLGSRVEQWLRMGRRCMAVYLWLIVLSFFRVFKF